MRRQAPSTISSPTQRKPAARRPPAGRDEGRDAASSSGGTATTAASTGHTSTPTDRSPTALTIAAATTAPIAADGSAIAAPSMSSAVRNWRSLAPRTRARCMVGARRRAIACAARAMTASTTPIGPAISTTMSAVATFTRWTIPSMSDARMEEKSRNSPLGKITPVALSCRTCCATVGASSKRNRSVRSGYHASMRASAKVLDSPAVEAG